MRRIFWKLAYGFVVIGHKFGASYKWVNVSFGAWRSDLFDELWQHEWYGDDICEMPSSVNIHGIRHTVDVSEGLVQFVSRDLWARLIFRRDPHERYAFMWYVECSGNAPADHICTAYKWVKAVYGGSHELKRPAIKTLEPVTQ